MINKQYQLEKLKRNTLIMPALLNIGFVTKEAIAHDIPTTCIFAAQGLFLLKGVEIFANNAFKLKPEYIKILKRALKIHLSKTKRLSKLSTHA